LTLIYRLTYWLIYRLIDRNVWMRAKNNPHTCPKFMPLRLRIATLLTSTDRPQVVLLPTAASGAGEEPGTTGTTITS